METICTVIVRWIGEASNFLVASLLSAFIDSPLQLNAERQHDRNHRIAWVGHPLRNHPVPRHQSTACLQGFAIPFEIQDSVKKDDCPSDERAVQKPNKCHDVNRVWVVDRVEEPSKEIGFGPEESRTAIKVRPLECITNVDHYGGNCANADTQTYKQHSRQLAWSILWCGVLVLVRGR